VVRRGSAAGPDGQQFDQIEKGRYLATAADCFACHTVPGSRKAFAGNRPIETPFGNITSPNITADTETSIGSWSDEQFDAAVRKGARPDGSRLYPAMPFTSYAKMSREDVLAIRAYPKPRPAGQQQGGANQESARSHRVLRGAYHRTCGAQFTDLRFKNRGTLLGWFSS